MYVSQQTVKHTVMNYNTQNWDNKGDGQCCCLKFFLPLYSPITLPYFLHSIHFIISVRLGGHCIKFYELDILNVMELLMCWQGTVSSVKILEKYDIWRIMALYHLRLLTPHTGWTLKCIFTQRTMDFVPSPLTSASH